MADKPWTRNSEPNRFFCSLESPRDFQLGFTFSSEARKCLRQIALSAIEGAVLTAIIVAGLRWFVEPLVLCSAVVGILAAYGTSTVSIAILSIARLRKTEFDGFMKAYGAGVGIRAVGLIALVVYGWGAPIPIQSALLASYALGVLGLLLVEIRQFSRHAG